MCWLRKLERLVVIFVILTLAFRVAGRVHRTWVVAHAL
jgi:hypothetical protein